eukprot:TRINITY_DN4151_c0_g1_i2.p1 TRINITY_DN4151_c0_g1~~TRINITY_DN4151_c0_g1_i2.p1  ORF type:complete len:326 (+),score=107.15 TRINITY_DN4151_c0_g1_i2:143-1120(+)
MRLQVLAVACLVALHQGVVLAFVPPSLSTAHGLRTHKSAHPHAGVASVVMAMNPNGKRAAIRRFIFGPQREQQAQPQQQQQGRKRRLVPASVRKMTAGVVAAVALRVAMGSPAVANAAPAATVERSVDADDDFFGGDLEVEDKYEEVVEQPVESEVAKKKKEPIKLGPTLIGGGTLAYVMYRCSVISATDMNAQRKRIREENTKFQQNAEEHMVEGEVAYNEDLMRELRRMKEENVGPGDKYAKETRRYNPEFAATHEPLDGPTEKQTGGGANSEDEDLLGQEARAADAAKAKAEEDRLKAEKAAAIQKLYQQSPESGDDDDLLS